MHSVTDMQYVCRRVRARTSFDLSGFECSCGLVSTGSRIWHELGKILNVHSEKGFTYVNFCLGMLRTAYGPINTAWQLASPAWGTSSLVSRQAQPPSLDSPSVQSTGVTTPGLRMSTSSPRTMRASATPEPSASSCLSLTT